MTWFTFSFAFFWLPCPVVGAGAHRARLVRLTRTRIAPAQQQRDPPRRQACLQVGQAVMQPPSHRPAQLLLARQPLLPHTETHHGPRDSGGGQSGVVIKPQVVAEPDKLDGRHAGYLGRDRRG